MLDQLHPSPHFVAAMRDIVKENNESLLDKLDAIVERAIRKERDDSDARFRVIETELNDLKIDHAREVSKVQTTGKIFNILFGAAILIIVGAFTFLK